MSPIITPVAPIARGWRIMLWGAAAYNLLIGVPGILTGATPSDRIVSLLVACFGIVYAITGTDPRRFAMMLWAGIIGKLGIIALLWPGLSDGTAPAGTSVILAGDGLFTLGFFALLWTLRRRAD